MTEISGQIGAQHNAKRKILVAARREEGPSCGCNFFFLFWWLFCTPKMTLQHNERTRIWANNSKRQQNRLHAIPRHKEYDGEQKKPSGWFYRFLFLSLVFFFFFFFLFFFCGSLSVFTNSGSCPNSWSFRSKHKVAKKIEVLLSILKKPVIVRVRAFQNSCGWSKSFKTSDQDTQDLLKFGVGFQDLQESTQGFKAHKQHRFGNARTKIPANATQGQRYATLFFFFWPFCWVVCTRLKQHKTPHALNQKLDRN